MKNMKLRLGGRGLRRFAGRANELTVCAGRSVGLAPGTKIDREAQAFESVLADRLA